MSRIIPAGGPLPMGPLDWGMLVLLSMLWGGSFFFAKVAVSELPPLVLVLARVSLAAALLAGVLAVSGAPMRVPMRMLGAFLVMGLLNNLVPFGLIFWAQTSIPSGLASILNATTPLFTVLVAHAFTRDEKLSAGRIIGVLAGFAGVAVMIGPGLLEDLGSHLPAQLGCLGAALSYGLSSVYGRRFRGLPPMLTAAAQLTASTVLLAPVVAVLHPPATLSWPSVPVVAAVVALAAASTAFAYILFFRILGRNGATNISLVTLLVPVSAVLLGAVFLREALEAREFAGFALIALGLAAIDGRPARWIAQRVGTGFSPR